MMEALLNMLPSAIGVAISPVPVIAVILMLMSKRAASNGLAFLVGWILTLTAIGLIMLGVGTPNDSAGGGNAAMDWIKLAVGVLFLLMAVSNWRGRPRPGHPSKMPKWMSSIDRVQWPFAFVLAVLLAGLNPKNLGLAIAGIGSIAEADLPGADPYLALAAFVGIASLSLALPLLYYFFAGARARQTLLGLKGWLAHHNAVIMAILLLVLGVKITIQAVLSLAG
jgi:hypothetical protein